MHTSAWHPSWQRCSACHKYWACPSQEKKNYPFVSLGSNQLLHPPSNIRRPSARCPELLRVRASLLNGWMACEPWKQSKDLCTNADRYKDCTRAKRNERPFFEKQNATAFASLARLFTCDLRPSALHGVRVRAGYLRPKTGNLVPTT